jgi:lipopolysaccharide/colanic/teichoic acid biosynthesis glycosyltransferase
MSSLADTRVVDVGEQAERSRARARRPVEVPTRRKVANRNRLARLSTHGGTLAILLLTSEWHAYLHGYSLVENSRSTALIAYFIVLATAAYSAGLPEATARRNPYLTSALAAGAGATVFSLLQLVLGTLLLPRLVVFSTAFGVMLWWGFCAKAVQRTSGNGDNHERIAFVGSLAERDKLQSDLGIAPERAADMVCSRLLTDVRTRARGAEPLVECVADCKATVLVLGRDAQDDRTLVSQVSTLHEAGVRVRGLVPFYDEWLGKLPVSELKRMSLMFDISEIHGQSYARVKRMLDVVVGLIGCVALVVVTPLVWIGDRFANRGPLLYRQTRVGRNHTTFGILKFRTMRESVSTDWTSENDPRITPFGRFLRRTHVDEVPQFVNILRGELSIVGPRPEQPRYVATLAEVLPFYQLRNLVRPGLTGWAQVKYGYAASERDALEKLQYDFYYLGHQSLGLDLRIIARTVRSTFAARGR